MQSHIDELRSTHRSSNKQLIEESALQQLLALDPISWSYALRPLLHHTPSDIQQRQRLGGDLCADAIKTFRYQRHEYTLCKSEAMVLGGRIWRNTIQERWHFRSRFIAPTTLETSLNGAASLIRIHK